MFKAGELADQLVQLRELHPSDLASAVLSLSPTRKVQLAAALQDSELADVLEQMTEQDQIRFLAGLGVDRVADVVEEMEPDDAADLLAEMSDDRARAAAGRDGERPGRGPAPAAALRSRRTAGGLMTSQPLIVAPDASVAEVLALIRDPEVAMTAAAQVYVCEPPSITPTGRYLGTCGFQRLLRQPPSDRVAECIEESTFVRPELPEQQVARADGRLRPGRSGGLRP